MKLSCQEGLLPGPDVANRWAVARDAGYEAIELLGFGDLALEARLPELRAVRANGAVFSSVCVAMGNFIGDADPEARADAVRNLKSQLSVIAELGGVGVITPVSCGKATTALPRLKSPLSDAEQRQVVLDALGELGEHAAAEGVAVLLEPLNRYETNFVHTLAQGVEICAALGQPSVKVMGDFYHMNIEEEDPARAFIEAGAVLAHVHICDNNRREPGAGHIDLAANCAALRRINYTGYLALECALRAPPEQALRNAAAVMREAIRAGDRMVAGAG